MYNLLVTGEKGAWEKFYYEYDSSRFLEYSRESIVSIFKELTEENIETLQSFPCIFAYEGNEDSIRIGYLPQINKKRGGTILIEYSFDEKIHKIPFSSINPIASFLDIRKWEMNRTHWAVKDEDLFERLHAALLIEDSFTNSLIKPRKLEKTKKTHKPEVSTVRGFIDKILIEKEKSGFELRVS